MQFCIAYTHLYTYVCMDTDANDNNEGKYTDQGIIN